MSNDIPEEHRYRKILRCTLFILLWWGNTGCPGKIAFVSFIIVLPRQPWAASGHSRSLAAICRRGMVCSGFNAFIWPRHFCPFTRGLFFAISVQNMSGSNKVYGCSSVICLGQTHFGARVSDCVIMWFKEQIPYYICTYSVTIWRISKINSMML